MEQTNTNVGINVRLIHNNIYYNMDPYIGYRAHSPMEEIHTRTHETLVGMCTLLTIRSWRFHLCASRDFERTLHYVNT